ncbi:hypothetical protein [Actinosynnema sp. NPDC023587]|uniref:hypothetical protein n=1 Tax=Actinosynnema sp. NPDC023587 TaxID=3154695 RepID=UPI0033EF18EC
MTKDKAGQLSVYAPFLWALKVPKLLLGNGTPDTTAHHVLLVMATHADPDGTNIRPSVATLTQESHFNDQRTTKDALRRLEAAQLVVRTGELTGGTVIWKLNFELEFSGTGAAEEFRSRREKALTKQAERNRRYRQRMRDAALERHVTPHGSVTDGAVEHHVTPQVPSHSQVSPATPALDQPLTSPGTFRGTLPLDPLRNGRAALGRTEDTPTAADVLPDTTTEVDPETHVPPGVRADRGEHGPDDEITGEPSPHHDCVAPEVRASSPAIPQGRPGDAPLAVGKAAEKCAEHPLLLGGTGQDGTPRCPLCRRTAGTGPAPAPQQAPLARVIPLRATDRTAS